MTLKRTAVHSIALLLAVVGLAPAGDLLDIAPYGQLSSWSGSEVTRLAGVELSRGRRNIGIEWDEERDVKEIRIQYAGEAPRGVRVEYWFKNWPYEPPKMPSFEDPMDDPWQGRWLAAKTFEACAKQTCDYRFQPLSEPENPLSKNLPGVRYRRTLKVRVVDSAALASIEAIKIYSGSAQRNVRLRVELGGHESPEAWSGSVSIYNGMLQRAEPWQFSGSDRLHDPSHWSFAASGAPKGLLLDVIAAQPDMPGSHDATVVTVNAMRKTGAETQDDSFSFAVDDLQRGPMAIPDRQARVVDLARSSSAAAWQPAKTKIRERILHEPEQTYQRASSEIPPLDPWHREWGGPVYLPLAPDSSWQKFAFEYGGDVWISKAGIKAKGRELARLQWRGDRITWRIGTGKTPDYRQDHRVEVSQLEDCLPVVAQRWQKDGIAYTEEAYATLLRGDLSPEGTARNEETPAILMLQISARRLTNSSGIAHLWLSADAAGNLTLEGRKIRGDGKLVGSITAPGNSQIAAEPPPDSSPPVKAIHIVFPLSGKSENRVILKIPCVSDLSDVDLGALEALDYAAQRERVAAYWKKIIEPAVRFRVPEPRFNTLAKGVIVQIHISATKDPSTGLFIVPAASVGYDEFQNEACYQILLLDTLGQFATSGEYLETMLRLQGSKDFPGSHAGPTDGIFHGTKIDQTYDYTESGYGLDHGTVLWTLAQHYLYSRDRAWFEHAWPHMRRAVDWIERERATTRRVDLNGHNIREYGLLPPSQLEDDVDWAHWFSVNAFAWAGMAKSAEALTDIGSPEAAQVQKQADAFRQDLRTAVIRAVVSAPVARMQDGIYEPYVPVLPTRRFRLFGPIRAGYYERYGHPEVKPLLRLGADRDTLCGAVVLLVLNVFTPGEPLANWILNDWEDNETLSSGMGMNVHGMTDDAKWFSQGGMVFQANLVNPIPVYLRRHEAAAAIRNLYNDFVACLYPDVNIFTEEFHQWSHASGPFYKISDEARFVNRLRDLLVLEDGQALWLAPGVPRRWLAAEEGVNVHRVQTFFGPVSYRLQHGSADGEIEASVELPQERRAKQNWLIVRVPHGHITGVTLDGRQWRRINRQLEAIELPARAGPMRLLIQYR